MEIRFNVTGAERKTLVTAVSELVGWDAVYKKAPTFAYVVNNITIDKNGTLVFDERTDGDVIARLLSGLEERGFVSEDTFTADVPAVALPDNEEQSDGSPAVTLPGGEAQDDDSPAETLPDEHSSDSLVIEIPLPGFTDADFDKLQKLVASKAALIKKAVGTSDLSVLRENDRLCFSWFTPGSSPREVEAYTQFVTALCDMAQKQQRIVAKEKPADSEKYAMRCFLLRLGFIGEAYASARKILLANLPGSGSFKSCTKGANAADTAPSDEGVDLADYDANPADNAATGSEVAAYE